ncbi:threonine aldolase family protein [Leucothrix pacifica]|uniref:Threonine aldolase n=1 Tax=Leucothrix pacifica TaxID=1247513 RepID=A0A317C2F6_9GAMM|nr:aminotransferase class I/II-fold pyridoxal phosphate-dependent enzyme [Leucothrix pacifica]PWQ92371.1 threonine aldolase [Leucothrix pacifica]
MSKYSFLDDYSEGCHPNILQALVDTNMSQQTAYGNDDYCRQAKDLIREHLCTDDTPIYFIAGGTLANLIIIASALRAHESVIAVSSGHIELRETGAIEATGHKIITVPPVDGKLTVEAVESALTSNSHFPHMTRPRMVYISNATETGTVYTKAELQALSAVCRSNNLLLLLDGARLASALTADINDLTLQDIAALTDIFWVGGTKVGALLGEAVVIPNPQLAIDFDFHIKQRGALLAKGRVLGLQFLELFKNDLLFELARSANESAQKLAKAATDNGFQLAATTESNQIFLILPNSLIEHLQERFEFYIWEKVDDKSSVIRLVTSWATDESQVQLFIEAMAAANEAA